MVGSVAHTDHLVDFVWHAALEHRFSIHIYAKIDISGRSIRTVGQGFHFKLTPLPNASPLHLILVSESVF
ncbi:MAG: hypothetical protein F6K14_05045 [Symploca sp. SIO2C1]|nr:hypothetical protein [Symploca sp. SIO2C1]